MVDERRSEPRKLTCIPAYFDSRESSQDLALIRDVSASGAKLFTQHGLDLEHPVTLHLCLGGETDPPRVVMGRVVRVDRRDLAVSDLWSWEIGIEFNEPITEYQAEIDELCRRQRSVGLLEGT